MSDCVNCDEQHRQIGELEYRLRRAEEYRDDLDRVKADLEAAEAELDRVLRIVAERCECPCSWCYRCIDALSTLPSPEQHLGAGATIASEAASRRRGEVG